MKPNKFHPHEKYTFITTKNGVKEFEEFEFDGAAFVSLSDPSKKLTVREGAAPNDEKRVEIVATSRMSPALRKEMENSKPKGENKSRDESH